MVGQLGSPSLCTYPLASIRLKSGYSGEVCKISACHTGMITISLAGCWVLEAGCRNKTRISRKDLNPLSENVLQYRANRVDAEETKALEKIMRSLKLDRAFFDDLNDYKFVDAFENNFSENFTQFSANFIR